MPEIAEVETVRQTLKRRILNKKIKNVNVLYDRIVESDLDEFKKSMKGIYTTSVVEETIDEAPFVYKPMQEILENIKDTVEVEKIIKPIYNFKAKNWGVKYEWSR